MNVEINVGACAIGTKVGVPHKEFRTHEALSGFELGGDNSVNGDSTMSMERYALSAARVLISIVFF